LTKTELKKVSYIIALLFVLAFGIIAASNFSVSADPIGIGKFIDIEIVGGGGSVTLTKLSSGETWSTNDAEPHNQLNEKVGAGTVSVQANENGNWEFSYWEVGMEKNENGEIIDPRIIDDPSNPYYKFKTAKGTTYIKAIFVEKTLKITATVVSQGGNDYIATLINNVPSQIYDQLVVDVEYNGSKTFDFYPDPLEENHVSAIQVDGYFESYALSYSFTNVQEDHTLTVYFSANGQAYVPPIQGAMVFLNEDGSLTFNDPVEGFATGGALDFPEGTSVILWDISTNALGNSYVDLALKYVGDLPENFAVYCADSVDALYSDVNGDGFVDNGDHVEVARGLSTSGRAYNATFDVNRDGELDNEDIATVLACIGTTLTLIPFSEEGPLPPPDDPDATQWWWFVGNIIYIHTDHFTIFRGR
jgi:hypothetical protein